MNDKELARMNLLLDLYDKELINPNQFKELFTFLNPHNKKTMNTPGEVITKSLYDL